MNNHQYAQATDADLMNWELEAQEAQASEAEQAHARWAEAGGYAANLTRPATRRPFIGQQPLTLD